VAFLRTRGACPPRPAVAATEEVLYHVPFAVAAIADRGYPAPMHRHLRRLGRVFASHPVYFITACTRDRAPCLASDAAAKILLAEWRDARLRHGWGIGRYVIMPDHVHFFCAEMPAEGAHNSTPLSDFLQRWKEWTSKRIAHAGMVDGRLWQPGSFDHVLRNEESYAEKWSYVRENPVRKELVTRAEDWPFQGFVDFDTPR
jgi:REP element-mobilizing transposase RayT